MQQRGEKEEEIKEYLVTRLDAICSNYNGNYADSCRKIKEKPCIQGRVFEAKETVNAETLEPQCEGRPMWLEQIDKISFI